METYFPQMKSSSCGMAGSCNVNVGETERAASALIGGILAVGGLRRVGSLSGLLMLAAGGGLLYRGMTGHCMLYDQLGMNTREERSMRQSESHLEPLAQDRENFDEVDEASYESFPASDPPTYSSAAASGPRYPR